MPSIPDPTHPSLLANISLKWTVRSCAFVASVLCAWLVWLKLNGDITSVAGCGGANGCDKVLGGRWSAWLTIPVSVLALGFYMGVFFLTLSPVQRWMTFQADRLLCGAAIMAILCAVWFVGLLGFVEHQFCPYCATAHLLGVVFAFPVLIRAWKLRQKEEKGFLGAAFSVALPGFLILVIGQVFGPKPQTHEIKETVLATTDSAGLNLPPKPTPRPGELVFFDGALVYKLNEVPFLGNPDGAYKVVDYFDYTCPSCRDMHDDLVQMKKIREDFMVVVLPCPLNRECNPNLPADITNHAGACELAKFALAVWRKAPSQFADYHHFLMRLPLPVNVDMAKKQASKLLGSETALNLALADPWIADRLGATFDEYRLLTAKDKKMPKLLLGSNRVMNGQARDTKTFLDMIATEFPPKK